MSLPTLNHEIEMLMTAGTTTSQVSLPTFTRGGAIFIAITVGIPVAKIVVYNLGEI